MKGLIDWKQRPARELMAGKILMLKGVSVEFRLRKEYWKRVLEKSIVQI